MIWEVEAGKGRARLFMSPPRLIMPNKKKKKKENEGHETFLLLPVPGVGCELVLQAWCLLGGLPVEGGIPWFRDGPS